jgi:hypothetical protein
MRYRVIKYKAGQIYISAGVKARIIEYKGNNTFLSQGDYTIISKQ